MRQRMQVGTHKGFTVGFILLLLSVVCTIESLCLFISFLFVDLYVLDDTERFMEVLLLWILFVVRVYLL